MFKISTEAMQAQLQSPAAKKLDALWQSVIDYRNTLPADLSFQNRYRKVREFFHQNVAKKFMDIVWKDFGLWIQEVRYVELWDSGFCTWMFFGDGKYQEGTLQLENILDGGTLERYWHVKIPENLSTDDFIKIASSYDLMTGAIKPSHREAIKKLVKSTIGFDIRTGFLLEDFLPKNGGVQNFTAREITAIILHELGHTLTLVEHAADFYCRQASYNYLTAAFKAAHDYDYKEAVKLSKAVAAIADKRGNKDVAQKINKLSIKFEGAMAQAGSNGDPRYKRTLIGGLLESIFVMAMDLIILPFDFVFGGALNARFDRAGQKQKKSDLPVNRRMLNWQERKADEYAFTHGYGKDQVAALAKLGALFQRLGKSEEEVEKINEAERLHKDISFLDKLHLILYAPMMTNDYGFNLYPMGVQRFKELLTLSVQQLKAAGADSELVRKYMEDIEIIVEHIDNFNKYDEFTAKVMRGYALFQKYMSIPSFYDCIMHGNVMKELETLVDEIQQLGGNLIHFYGMRLQALAAAKKGK